MGVTLSQNIIDQLLKDSLEDLKKSIFYNKIDINSLKINRTNGIIYFIYIKKNNEYILKYIGKSNGKYFKSRLKAHFFGIGKGTQSKFERIKLEDDVYFKYIETTPNSLRNLIEELLIEKYQSQNLWNYKS
ncbi:MULTISPECIES: GIY-YIG nuclease family protein [Empedobacter]|uniref:GIY-YIG nuclease family protein n=1 Tax=Empedobacter TaxID=59734 RepID=UPI0025764550|nr:MULTISPECIES: GIY-YIG nuclease family protein [Empedobacter]MDM1042100.1 GIY-YIG nuclease family protein [Empedobacter brevis]MDM1136025.1 GIY-YIG nuclease family protein [Empedobacter sp. R750]